MITQRENLRDIGDKAPHARGIAPPARRATGRAIRSVAALPLSMIRNFSLHRFVPVLAAVCLPFWGHAQESSSGKEKETEKEEAKEPAAKQLSPEATAASKRAVTAMVKRDWDLACKEWKAVLKLEPENAAALSNLGKSEYQRQHLKEAKEALEKAVALRPELGDSWIALAMVCQDMGLTMLSISSATRAVHESPADPRLRNGLAVILKRAGWMAAAESELQKTLDLSPDYSEAHFNLAVLYIERKPPSVEMARRHYDRAVELGAARDEVIERQMKGEDIVDEEMEEPDGSGTEDAPESTPPTSPTSPPPPKDKKAPVTDGKKEAKKPASAPAKPTSRPKRNPS